MRELRKKIETYIPIIGGVFVMGIFLYLFIFEMGSDVVYACSYGEGYQGRPKYYRTYHRDKKCPYMCNGKEVGVSITKMIEEDAEKEKLKPCGYCCD